MSGDSAKETKTGGDPPDRASLAILILYIVSRLIRHAETLVLRDVNIDWDAPHSSQRRHKNAPASFIFREIQKIILPIYSKLQFESPLLDC